MGGNILFRMRCVDVGNSCWKLGEIIEVDENNETRYIEPNGKKGGIDINISDFKEWTDRMNYTNQSKWELIEEKGENKMEDLRELLEQGFVVKHIDDKLSKIEMNSEGKLVISGDDHWCLVDKLTKELYGYNGDTKVAIKEIYGYSDYNSHAHKVSLDGRELIWKRIELSPTQLRLEELEKKPREIADEIEKLRKEL